MAAMVVKSSLILIILCVFNVNGDNENNSKDNIENIDQPEIAPPYYLTTVKATQYILPKLKWSLGELEPYMDQATVDAHYNGHHNAYRTKLNKALQEWREEVRQTVELLVTKLSYRDDLQQLCTCTCRTYIRTLHVHVALIL